MRWYMIAVITVVLSVVGYMALGVKLGLDQAAAERIARDMDDEAGVTAVLEAYEKYDFRYLVLAPEIEPGQREFRGQAVSGDVSRAAWGMLETGCETGRDAPDCWELVTLQVDGRLLESRDALPEIGAPTGLTTEIGPELTGAAEITDSEVVNITAIAPVPRPEDEGEVEAGSAPDGEAEAALASEPSEVTESAPDAEAGETVASTGPASSDLGLQPSHTVRLGLVNARSSPSVQSGNIAVKLRRNTALGLMARTGGWGQFEVLDGEHKGMVVWVAFKVLDEIRGS